MKRLFLCLVAVALVVGKALAEDMRQISSVQYWIDNEYDSAQVNSTMEFDVDCSGLPPGLHSLFFRLADNHGSYSPLYQHTFFKPTHAPAATKIETIQYWWDDMTANAVDMPYTGDSFELSTDALPFGLHSLKYRVKDDAGRWSGLSSHYFYKGEHLDSARIVSYTYWWNDMADKAVTRQLETPSLTFTLDKDLVVPQEAKTNYAGHYTATLNIVITDNRGAKAALASNIVYPDNDTPVTDIDADKYVTSSTVKITWVENSGDKMGDYNVYYSRDNGPFLLWLADTKLTSATFRGERGSAYVFTVTGRDAFGNREEFDETKCVSVAFE